MICKALTSYKGRLSLNRLLEGFGLCRLPLAPELSAEDRCSVDNVTVIM